MMDIQIPTRPQDTASLRQLAAWLVAVADGTLDPFPNNDPPQLDCQPNQSLRTRGRPLPDAKVIRRIIQIRADRLKFFGTELFADPAWEMLLDLTAAKVECRPVAVTSLCLASGVPTTTALRWIGLLVKRGLCRRKPDRLDGRRVFIELSDEGATAMANYFAKQVLRSELSSFV